MTAIKLTPKQLLDRMRAVTAKLLGYDLEHLTPAQQIRLDRAASIRLMLDDVQGRLLAGLEIDMAKFCAASEALERMLGGNPDQQTTTGQHDDFAGAREELIAFLSDRAEKLEYKAERARTASLEAQSGGSKLEPPASPQHDQGIAPTVTNVSVETPAAVLMPADEQPPIANVHHSYVDHDVIETDADRYQRINGGTATPAAPRPPSALTQSYFGGAPGNVGLGNSPWRTRDWSPRRGW